MTTRKQVPDLVASHSAFNANGTLYAKVVNDFYAAFSYGEHFPVAIRRRSVAEPWIVNKDGYSNTTARHKGLVRKGIAKCRFPETIEASTSTLRSLLNGGV